MSLIRAVVTAAVVVIGGCGSDSDGPHIEPRAGTSVVYEGPAVSDPDCIFRQTFPAHCPSWTDLVVQDAAREGDHVALLLYTSIPGGSFGVVLAESDDLGRTWTNRFLGPPPTRGQDPSLQLAGGRTYIHWVVIIEAPLGGRPIGVRWEMADTGIEHTDVIDDGLLAQIMSTKNGRARTFIGPTDLNDSRSGFLDISWAPGDLMPRFQQRCVGVEQCFMPLSSRDGITFVGQLDQAVSGAGGLTYTNACVYTSKNDAVTCVPWSTWPARDAAFNRPPHAVIEEDNGDFTAGRLYEENGHTYVQRLLPGTSALGPRIDMDEGRPARYGDVGMYASWRSRYAGLTGVVRPSGYIELYRLRGVGGVDRVVFPDSPCRTLESCAEIPFLGYGQAVYLLPLEGDDALVFYNVDTYLNDASNHQWIYASRETITYEELLAPQQDPDLLFPGWRPATPLEEMCTRAAACFPDAGLVPFQCVNFWATTSSATPGSEAALAAFLATPPGCGSFATTWPEVTVADADCDVSSCPSGCDGDAGVFVCRATAPCGLQCTQRGGTCLGNGTCSLSATLAECDSCTSDGRAVTCGTVDGVLTIGGVNACAAGGYTCELGPRCVDRTACPTDGDRCENGTSVQCNAGVETRTDCASKGAVCGANGFCGPDPAAQACPAFDGECLGSTLFTCAGDGSSWTRVECTALGFSGCVADASSGTARCQ